jgi:alanine-glyoxylate transaminase/serine-glyoxylate transaminase/serine-pyruvate transaminase
MFFATIGDAHSTFLGIFNMLDEINPPARLLLGPGPSMVHSRVLRAMSVPLVGHLDPEFLKILNQVQASLRWLFQTQNPFTIPVSGTGSAAMEMAIINLIEPGDSVIVGVNGVFGNRMVQVIERCGGKAIKIERPWGDIIPIEAIEQALQSHKKVKALAIVQAETSTGVLQPINELGRLCQNHNALLIVDAVTSLGGLPLQVDQWGIDACYSATQKCLSCPPGIAPLTISSKALEIIQSRKTPCQSWYLDCALVGDYWNDQKRTYHHTAPISMIYGLRECLRLIEEEGLETRYNRHQLNSTALLTGLECLGFSLLPAQKYHLPPLTCVRLPTFVDDKAVRAHLLNTYHIEVGGGLGTLAGKVWRIGLMGESSNFEHVMHLLGALDSIWTEYRYPHDPGQSITSALSAYNHNL